MIPFRWGSWRCEQVVGRSLFLSAFWAVSFCWSSGEESFIYVQKTSQAVNSGPSHGTNSELERILFESNCAGCHGLDGRGGEKGPNIATRPEISGHSDNEILAILRQGVAPAGMPGIQQVGRQETGICCATIANLAGTEWKNRDSGKRGRREKTVF